VAFGTFTDSRKAPRPLTDAVGIPVADPSQVIWTAAFGLNPSPVTVTLVPGVPLPGETVRLGPAALAPPKGRT
jgi:hypothetical protein